MNAIQSFPGLFYSTFLDPAQTLLLPVEEILKSLARAMTRLQRYVLKSLRTLDDC